MKNLLVLVAVFLLGGAVYAQMPQGMGGNASMQGPGKIGHVYGKLLDSDGKPVGDASVMLMQNKMDTVSKKMK